MLLVLVTRALDSAPSWCLAAGCRFWAQIVTKDSSCYSNTDTDAFLGVESQELILINSWNLKCKIVSNSVK